MIGSMVVARQVFFGIAFALIIWWMVIGQHLVGTDIWN
jgi:hypothetical protein